MVDTNEIAINEKNETSQRKEVSFSNYTKNRTKRIAMDIKKRAIIMRSRSCLSFFL